MKVIETDMMVCEKIATEAAQTIVCAASSVYWWVTPIVIAISAAIAGYLSWISISSNREMAKKRATLDFIERTESTEYYQKLYQAFSEVRKDNGGLMQLSDPINFELIR